MRTPNTVLLILLCASPLVSQDRPNSIGVALGPSLISLRVEKASNIFESRVGSLCELYYANKLSDHLELKMGLGLDRKGAQATTTAPATASSPATTLELNYVFDYITIPLTISYFTKGKTKLKVGAGPAVGVLLSAKVKGLGNLGFEEDFTEDTRSLDLGMIAELGLETPISEQMVAAIMIRENLGLLDTQNGDMMHTTAVKNNSLALLAQIAYRF